MSRLIVLPSGPLSGEVPIGGAKNSVLKLMAATTLCTGTFRLRNVPRITDVEFMAELLRSMGLEVSWADDGELRIERGEEISAVAPYEQVEKMRASSAVLGPLLASCGRAEVSMPGGDDFGTRPIDMHLRGLEAMGARFTLSHGVIRGEVGSGGPGPGRLHGAVVTLDYPSVGATENLMMAAALAEGRTVIQNAAREPEIQDLAAFLNRMGARVLSAGSETITVEGVDQLRAVEHEVIPDRVEAASYLAMLGAAGGELRLVGARADHLDLLITKLGEMGMRISPERDGLWAMARPRLRSANLSTLPYPGLATDYLPPLVALLAVSEGRSYCTENVFSGRFRYIGELARMGADVRVDEHHLVIDGVDRLSGAPVRAVDIRAGAALVVAALRAEGQTEILDTHHLERGYERFVEKLRGIGVQVTARADHPAGNA